MHCDMMWCESAHPPQMLVIPYAHGLDLLSSHELWRVCLETVLHDGLGDPARGWPVVIVHPSLVLQRRLHAGNTSSVICEERIVHIL